MDHRANGVQKDGGIRDVVLPVNIKNSLDSEDNKRRRAEEERSTLKEHIPQRVGLLLRTIIDGQVEGTEPHV